MTRLPPEINRLIGRAMHKYEMLADGDRVMIAVSGGVDSLVLCRVLDLWRRKAPIHYELLAVHLDMGFAGYRPRPELYGKGQLPELAAQQDSRTSTADAPPAQAPTVTEPAEAPQVEADGLLPPLPGTAAAVACQLKKIGLPYYIEETPFGPQAMEAEEGKNGCYHCSSRRRNRLFALAREQGCNKLALGHHQEDIIETFFLNLLYGGNLSTMVPKQRLFAGRLHLIRPLTLLDKAMVRRLGDLFQVEPVSNPCPLTDNSKRREVRDLLATITANDPRLSANIFAALGNVRPDYLL